MDEMWSDVGSKAQKQWIWLAMDATPREIIGVYIGVREASPKENRSRQSARQFWQSLPPVDRQCAICYTDFWEAYEQVLPSKRHHAVGKETGYTSSI